MKDIEPLMGRFSLETDQECLLLDEEIHTWFSRGGEGRQAPVWLFFWNHGLILGRWDILPLCKEDVPALYEYTRKWMGDDAANTSDEKLAGWLETCCGESLVESGLDRNVLSGMETSCRNQTKIECSELPLLIRCMTKEGGLRLPKPLYSALGSSDLLACAAFNRCEIMSRSAFENRARESGDLWRAASMLQLEDPPERENGDNV